METKIVHVRDIVQDKKAITAAAQMLIAGELVAMPTETVYGLAANGMDELAVKRLYEAKQRPGYKAFSLQVPDVSMVNDIAQQVPDMAWRLFEKFCPGPITIVLPKNNNVPSVVTGGKKTVGIRIPANDIALEVLKAVGVPLAVPSANISAHPSPTSAQMVYDDMQGLIPLILDGGPCNLGIESTIVDCTGDEPVIIRQGAISEKKILDCINNKD
ncbi:L-threonylcarbamoyladenylate synthase [Anaerovibrio sp.]|uniref:L-threonylcarbamoyladenylate synthase n=1 Tax=Anaerovibrio sp. TaxID=1872532 RepID=UPI0025BEF123|nr:L-threonylcarbamoyladenylate synthase [Anaerovibrio sp.]MBR2141738.1 threonylcarbamoyl-AMP synthase [Anaerovibrio sp.]